MAKTKTTLIVGAGAVGTNSALVLDKLGLHVVLVHNGDDIFTNSAANTAFIWHETGQEYCRKGHQETGELCIAGAATQRLMFPMDFLSTQICNPKNPVKFFISNQTASDSTQEDSYVPVKTFKDNVEHMRGYFTKKIYEPTKAFLQAKHSLTDEEAHQLATEQLGCNPESFSQESGLHKTDIVQNVAVGYTATGDGINMPQLYAYQKAAFRQSKVRQEFNCSIGDVTKTPSGQYEVKLTNGKKITADSIILAAGAGNPELATKIPHAKPCTQGTYYLNTMVHVTLPEGGDTHQIIFTLQQIFGGAFTCIDRASRRYVVYSPDPTRSQVEKHTYDPDSPVSPPTQDWSKKMAFGLNTDPNRVDTEAKIEFKRIQGILAHASTIYPVLQDAQIIQAPLRVVFNANSADSPDGLDRRVRAIQNKEIAPNVFVTHGPKLTNSLLTALTVSHQALLSMDINGLPTSTEYGVGPLNINILETSEMINFKGIQGVMAKEALEYALRYKLPASMIRKDHPQFSSRPFTNSINDVAIGGMSMK